MSHSLSRRVLSGGLLGIVLLLGVAGVSHAAAKDWPKGVSWSGSALGGAHYIYGTGFVQILGKHLGIQTAVEATAGPWQSVDLCNSANTDFVPVPTAQLYEAYHGLGKAKGKKYDNLRAVMPMYAQYLQWWTLPTTGIKTFRDLAGKRVDMSGPGSFMNDYGRKILATFNVVPKQITSLTNFDDSNTMLVDGQLDAAAAWSGVPAPPAAEIISTRQGYAFGLPRAEAEKFAAENPGVFPALIPANTYAQQTEPIETLALWAYVTTHKNLSEDFVYNAVKTIFENYPELEQVYKAAKGTTAADVNSAPIPLHKGAYRYYKEKGYEIPKAAMPVD